MNHTVTVPVTSYHKVDISRSQLIEILKKEARSLCGRYESITSRNGKRVFYIAGYGSHDIGEEYGPEAPDDIVQIYDKIWSVIFHLNDKIKEDEEAKKK